MVTGGHAKSFARVIAVADAADGAAAEQVGGKIASWASARGIDALLLDASGRGGMRARRLGESSLNISRLAGGALKGYLACEGGFGCLVCDVKFRAGALENLSRAYDLIIAASSQAALTPFSDALPNVPALVVADAAQKGGLSKTADLIDAMLGGAKMPRPVAFVLKEGDPRIGAKLSGRLRVSFWGDSKDADLFAERALDAACRMDFTSHPEDRVENRPPEPPNDTIHSAPAAGLDVATRKIVEEVRSGAEFKDLKKGPAGREADDALRKKVAAAARRAISAMEPEKISNIDIESLVRRVVNDSVGMGPLESLMADPEVTEIMINGFEEIYAERKGIITKTPLKFYDEGQLLSVTERMVSGAGRRIDESSPMVDARLQDGSRLNVVIPPVSVDGPCVTIRRFVAKMRDIGEIVSSGMLTKEAAAFLRGSVAARLSIVVSGGTGAGKTTLLNSLASAISNGERVVTIEDAAELSLGAGHVVRLEARPANIEGKGAVTIRELVRNALRMRPDRIVVGECRGPEALDMLQAMNTGHEGSLTTVHANSPRDALSRLETMVLMAGLDLPLASVREQIVRAIDIIIQVSRIRSGERRVTEIVEVTGMEGATPCMQTIAETDPSGRLVPTGLVPRFAEKLRARNLPVPTFDGGL